jgi:hypothetical protein
MFVKPKSGLKVRDPDTRAFLPEGGREVPPSLYWTRRVREGDVIKCAPAPVAPAPVQASKEPGK